MATKTKTEPEQTFRVAHKYARIAPRKCRYVADLVRGQSLNSSIEMLQYCHRKGARLIEKLINSSIANATYSGTVDVADLYIKEIRVDEGPTLKRWRPRARGRACPIHKRTCHINLVVAERREPETNPVNEEQE